MSTPRCEAVRRAAGVVEDLHRLGELLNVSIDELRDWLAGRANPPVHVFLRAVDIIDAQDAARIAPRRHA
jgi:hypothetical protein